MPEFACDARFAGEALVLQPRGYLDKAAGETLLALARKTMKPGTARLALDLSGTPVINSSGLATLVELITLVLDEREGAVAVVGLSGLARSALSAIGILAMVREAPSEADAIRLLEGA